MKKLLLFIACFLGGCGLEEGKKGGAGDPGVLIMTAIATSHAEVTPTTINVFKYDKVVKEITQGDITWQCRSSVEQGLVNYRIEGPFLYMNGVKIRRKGPAPAEGILPVFGEWQLTSMPTGMPSPRITSDFTLVIMPGSIAVRGVCRIR